MPDPDSTISKPPPPILPPQPGQPPPTTPVPAVIDVDEEECEGCGELVPGDTLRESEDMVLLCPKCAALPNDDGEEG